MQRNRLFQLLQDNLNAPRSYEVKAQDGEAEILVYDAIGGWFGLSAEQFVKDVAAIEADMITVRINSPGGDVFDGRSMMTALANHPALVVAQIDGLAASAATALTLAADEVRIAEGAWYMIHNAWGVTIGNAQEHRATVDLLERVDASLVRDYSAKTGVDDQQIADWMAAETWFEGAEAVEHGFADATIESTAVENRFKLDAYAHVPQALTEPPKPRPSMTWDEADRRLSLYERANAA